MFKFGTTSKKRLATVDNNLQLLMEVAIRQDRFDLSVIEGVRSYERQRKLFVAGDTKTMASKHITGRAVDIGIWKHGKIDYSDVKAYYVLAGIIYTLADQLGVKVRWGGNWDSDADMNDQDFDDLVHWELLD